MILHFSLAFNLKFEKKKCNYLGVQRMRSKLVILKCGQNILIHKITSWFFSKLIVVQELFRFLEIFAFDSVIILYSTWSPRGGGRLFGSDMNFFSCNDWSLQQIIERVIVICLLPENSNKLPAAKNQHLSKVYALK